MGRENFLPFDIRESETCQFSGQQLSQGHWIVRRSGYESAENNLMELDLPTVITKQRYERFFNRTLRRARAEDPEGQFFQMKVRCHELGMTVRLDDRTCWDARDEASFYQSRADKRERFDPVPRVANALRLVCNDKAPLEIKNT